MLFIQKYSTHCRVQQVIQIIIAAGIMGTAMESIINIAVIMKVHMTSLNVRIIVTKIKTAEVMTHTSVVDHLMVDAISIPHHLAVQVASA